MLLNPLLPDLRRVMQCTFYLKSLSGFEVHNTFSFSSQWHGLFSKLSFFHYQQIYFNFYSTYSFLPVVIAWLMPGSLPFLLTMMKTVLLVLEMHSVLSEVICWKLHWASWPLLFTIFLIFCFHYLSYLSLIKYFSAKYDLILDEQAEDSKSSHSHTSKKHKKKTRHCSEEKDDEEYMPIKNPNQVFLTYRVKHGKINVLSFCTVHLGGVI